MGSSSIQDYAVIGDCRSAALISKSGSLDWLCWPRFDSPSIFARVLDNERGGHWSIAPLDWHSVRREYVSESNVLATHFTCAGGQATLTDFMPAANEDFKHRVLLPEHELCRQITCDEGDVEIALSFRPRPAYGRDSARIRPAHQEGLRIDVGRGAYMLRATAPLTFDSGEATGRFRLRRGETISFSLTYSEEAPAVFSMPGESTDAARVRTVRWWQQWAQRNQYRGPYHDAVTRSALALKLLTYSPSGAIIAAPTTSLPELPGGSLNWDYRYCWLRDASLTVRALVGLGYRDEADAFLAWLLHATRLTQPRLRVLYSVFGGNAPREHELPHLRGYADSRPVRVGNLAREQFQLDVYGEVIDAAWRYAKTGGKFDRPTQVTLVSFGEYVASHWDLPDDGIWEPRNARMNHTHSRLLCWVTLERLLALGEEGIVDGVPRRRFSTERDRIREQIVRRGWNPDLQSYVATLDGSMLDASLLLISWYGFEQADSPRMQSTYRKISESLGAGDSLLYRYRREPPEGAFGVCGFWAVEHLAGGSGTLDEAHTAFQNLLRYQNDVGLFAEEIAPVSGEPLGNFPQAFTHVGLISAALAIAEREQRERNGADQHGGGVEAA